jgi:hypothetical protein
MARTGLARRGVGGSRRGLSRVWRPSSVRGVREHRATRGRCLVPPAPCRGQASNPILALRGEGKNEDAKSRPGRARSRRRLSNASWAVVTVELHGDGLASTPSRPRCSRTASIEPPRRRFASARASTSRSSSSKRTNQSASSLSGSGCTSCRPRPHARQSAWPPEQRRGAFSFSGSWSPRQTLAQLVPLPAAIRWYA